MQIRSRKMGVATYLSPEGPLLASHLDALRQVVDQARSQGETHLVLELRHVSFIDGQSLEYLEDLSGEIRDSGGSLRLAHPSPTCREILAITRFDQTIPLFDDVESAGRSFL